MNLRSRSLIVACAAILSAGPAEPVKAQGTTGDKQRALALFEKGKVQYDLGRWKQAVDLWTKAYETYNAPEFLFNIGQAYRHEGECGQATFFYRRYLATKPNARNRSEVEGFIQEQEAKCKTPAGQPADGEKSRESGGREVGAGVAIGGRAGSSAGKEPGPVSGPFAGAKDGGRRPGEGPEVAEAGGAAAQGDEETEGEEYEEYDESVRASAERPRLFASRVAVGPSFPSMGNLDVGTLVSLALGIGHPFYVGELVLEPGVLVTYTPVPWEVEDMALKHTAGLTGFLANLGATHTIVPKLSIRAEAGAGIMIFSGLTVDGNPFLAPMETATGPLSMFEARGALGVEYAITKNFVVHAQPVVFTYSPTPALREEIRSITRFEMLVGAGYAM